MKVEEAPPQEKKSKKEIEKEKIEEFLREAEEQRVMLSNYERLLTSDKEKMKKDGRKLEPEKGDAPIYTT